MKYSKTTVVTHSPRRPLLRTIGPFLVIVILLASLSVFSMDTLTATRAFVGGESLWSKGQKDGVTHLRRYVETGAESDFQDFRAAFAFPLGDRKARLALEQPEIDLAAARQGFLEGGNHPDDIPALIRLYRRFKRISFVAEAIKAWSAGDDHLIELSRLADDIHRSMEGGSASPMEQRLAIDRIESINMRLTPLESRFSQQLGVAARKATMYLLIVTLGLTALLLLVGVLISRRMIRRGEQSEDALAISERRKDAVVGAALDAIITTDHEGRIVEVNPAAEHIFGFDATAVLGSRLVETIVPPSFRQTYLDRMAGHLQAQPDETLARRTEITAMRADGSEFPAELATTGIVVDGKVLFTAYLRDISESKEAQRRLLESEDKYRKLVEQSPEAIFVRCDGKFRMVNRACVNLLKAGGAEELIGKPVENFIHPDSRALSKDRIQPIFGDTVAVPFFEEKWLRADGGVFDAEVAEKPFMLRGEHTEQVVIRDITERKQTERLLQGLVEGTSIAEAEKFFPALVQHMAYALDVRYAVVSECLPEDSGRARALAFWSDGALIPGYEYQLANTPCQNVLKEGRLCFFPENLQTQFPEDACLVDLDAHSYLGAPLQTAQGDIVGHVFVMNDKPLRNEERAKSIMKIFASRAASEVERQRTDRSIRYMADHDMLTALPNRREFERRLHLALASARDSQRPYAVMFIDLDQFKVVNDTCGHAAGDEMLRQVSTALRSRLRKGDILARLGGDEFGVLLDGCTPERSPAVAEELRQAVADLRFVWRATALTTSCSIGMVNLGEGAFTLADLMSTADTSCYMAKEKGRNRVQTYHPQDAELSNRKGEMNWVARIQRALAEDRFQLYEQEIVNVADPRLTGAYVELLIRMIDDKGEPVPPMAFIPAAERYNLMPAIDRWVIRSAFAGVSALIKQGRRLEKCAINLSGASVGDERMLQFIREQHELHKVTGSIVTFEITETAAIANLSRAARFMHELTTLGYRFALDDFGAGMASFGYLKHLPVDYLKIDGSFVKDLLTDPVNCAMVEAINQIGHVMGKQTIAEFVENEATLRKLQEIGVDYAQGFGIARPQAFGFKIAAAA